VINLDGAPTLQINVAEALAAAVREGMGLGLLPLYSAISGLRSGELVWILPEYTGDEHLRDASVTPVTRSTKKFACGWNFRAKNCPRLLLRIRPCCALSTDLMWRYPAVRRADAGVSNRCRLQRSPCRPIDLILVNWCRGNPWVILPKRLFYQIRKTLFRRHFQSDGGIESIAREIEWIPE
jgi:hypothetical protein